MRLSEEPVEIDFKQIVYKEVQVTGFCDHNWSVWKRAVKQLEQGRVQRKPLVTKKLPITEWRKDSKKQGKGESN